VLRQKKTIKNIKEINYQFEAQAKKGVFAVCTPISSSQSGCVAWFYFLNVTPALFILQFHSHLLFSIISHKIIPNYSPLIPHIHSMVKS